jgi:hypothetical protein
MRCILTVSLVALVTAASTSPSFAKSRYGYYSYGYAPSYGYSRSYGYSSRSQCRPPPDGCRQ